MNKTWIYFVLDESGSMERYWTDTISGHNAYLKGLQAETRVPMEYTLQKFGTHIRGNHELIVDRVPITRVAPLSKLNYRPNGGTPLFDATMSAIADIQRRKAKDDRIVLVILTDGEENQSREFTYERVGAAISAAQADGWAIVFLGANFDAWNFAGKISLNRNLVQRFEQDKTVAVFKALAVCTVTYAVEPDRTADEFWDATDATRFGGKNRTTY